MTSQHARMFIVAFFLLASLASPIFAAEKAPRVFRAGAAVADITPPLGELVRGGWTPAPASAVHDRLHARSLVLDDGENRLAIVIVDNLGIPREVFDAARVFIGRETQLDADHVFMAATHTHSSVSSTNAKYQAKLARGIADAVRDAERNLQPAQIAWGAADEPTEVFNRRWYVSDSDLLTNPFGGVDKVRMNPGRGRPELIKPAGPIDPEISFISVRTPDGRPIALLANYSLHYVGGVVKGELSADYFGIFSRRIGELLGAEKIAGVTGNNNAARVNSGAFVGIMSNGTSGDINNINFPTKPTKKYAPYEKMAEVAEHVAQRVIAAHAKLEYHDWVPLGSARREITLRSRKPDKKTLDYFARILASPDGAVVYHRHERAYADRVRRLFDGPDEITIPLQAMRIGDLGVAAIPFEVFAEIGLEIKDQSPFSNAFTIELANDYRGYLPTPRQHELGGYETWMGTNKVQLDASELIVKTILELMNEL